LKEQAAKSREAKIKKEVSFDENEPEKVSLGEEKKYFIKRNREFG